MHSEDNSVTNRVEVFCLWAYTIIESEGLVFRSNPFHKFLAHIVNFLSFIDCGLGIIIIKYPTLYLLLSVLNVLTPNGHFCNYN